MPTAYDRGRNFVTNTSRCHWLDMSLPKGVCACLAGVQQYTEVELLWRPNIQMQSAYMMMVVILDKMAVQLTLACFSQISGSRFLAMSTLR